MESDFVSFAEPAINNEGSEASEYYTDPYGLQDGAIKEPELLGDDVKHLNSSQPGVKPRPMPQFFLITTAQFSGYACLFGLQSFLRVQVGVVGNQAMSDLFGIFVAFLFMGNLIFRIGHNFIFMPIPPYYRVVISMFAMVGSTMVNGACFLFPPGRAPLAFVAVSYFLGGVGIGTFEANILNISTPYGKTAKYFAVQGIPIGVNLITVVGFMLLAFFPHPELLYLVTGAMLVAAILVYVITVPYVAVAAETSPELIFKAARDFRSWLPAIAPNAIAMMINMATVSMFCPALVTYMYSPGTSVAVLPFLHIPQASFMALYSFGVFCGDTFSRRFAYSLTSVNPLLFLLLNAIGVLLVLSSVPALVLVAGAVIMFGNGSIYAISSRRIDSAVPIEFNLIAFSAWLFVGDFGSVFASLMTQPVSQVLTAIYS